MGRAGAPSGAWAERRPRAPRSATIATALAIAGLASQRAAATTPGLWERVAASPEAEADRLLTEAEALLAAPEPAPGERGGGPSAVARADTLARRALALAPDDFRGLAVRAEVERRAGRADAALVELARSCARAPAGALAGACWFELGVERSRRGLFAEAIDAYERRLATGGADGASSAVVRENLGELLMALGRLDEAEDRYREALRLATPVAGHIEDRHGLALATYGLAVVLDRAGEAAAGRETMARALALDPRAGLLEAAREPGGDVFFIPEADVFYYLGLAYEVAGRADDAEAAWQDFAERAPRSRYVERARAHLAALEGRAPGEDGAPARAASSPHVTAVGTVSSRGPIPAPLVDAAWRQRPTMVDACLDEAARASPAATRPGFRFALELDFDAAGAVTGVAVELAPPLEALARGPFPRCVEAAVRAGLRVPRPRLAKPTHARLELLVGVGAL